MNLLASATILGCDTNVEIYIKDCEETSNQRYYITYYVLRLLGVRCASIQGASKVIGDTPTVHRKLVSSA